MTTQAALQVIYEAQKRPVPKVGSTLYYQEHGTIVSPTEDTPEGLAEFGRLVVWAWNKFECIQLCPIDDYRRYFVSVDTDRMTQTAQEEKPQEAFVQALAAALVAREKGEGEES
jgi:hypothetical protein